MNDSDRDIAAANAEYERLCTLGEQLAIKGRQKVETRQVGRFGEKVPYYPTPDEYAAAGLQVEDIRRRLANCRSELMRLADCVGQKDRFEDAEGALTVLISYLYEFTQKLPEWAQVKRETLAEAAEHPNEFVVEVPI